MTNLENFMSRSGSLEEAWKKADAEERREFLENPEEYLEQQQKAMSPVEIVDDLMDRRRISRYDPQGSTMLDYQTLEPHEIRAVELGEVGESGDIKDRFNGVISALTQGRGGQLTHRAARELREMKEEDSSDFDNYVLRATARDIETQLRDLEGQGIVESYERGEVPEDVDTMKGDYNWGSELSQRLAEEHVPENQTVYFTNLD
jgi:hypothetical protein